VEVGWDLEKDACKQEERQTKEPLSEQLQVWVYAELRLQQLAPMASLANAVAPFEAGVRHRVRASMKS
jgi:hypothetical protein